MRNTRASILCSCLAALPLVACAGTGPVAQQQQAANIAYSTQSRPGIAPVAYTGPATPAAVLVFLPGTGFGAPDMADVLGDVPPALWADQDLGVVTPRITDTLLAEERDMDRTFQHMLAYARAVANAPIWLVGSGPEIQNALASLPPGHGPISGVVVTSVSSPSGTCSRTIVYSSPSRSGVPTVQVRSSGNACEAGAEINPGMRPPVFEQVPQQPAPSRSPHTILVRNEKPQATPATNARPLVRLIADRIKQSPQG